MRALLLFAVLASPLVAQDVVVDRAAFRKLLEEKKLSLEDFRFDMDHIDSMPPGYFAGYSGTKHNIGHLKLFRRVQKEPVTFPEEMNALAARILKGEMWEAMHEAIDREFKPAALPEPVKLEGLPEELAAPVGRIVAAMGTKDASTILRAIGEARAALAGFAGKVDWENDGVVVTSERKPGAPGATKLWIKFGGDDTYAGEWAAGTSEKPVSVVVDTGGNDTYTAGNEEGAQGVGQGGVGILVDLAGDDTYRSTGPMAQGAGHQGTGVLYDAAGNDRYDARYIAQGSGTDGFGVLVDAAGNDSYVSTYGSQAYAGPRGFGLLLDHAGDDAYLGRDPMNGTAEIEIPAPQDEKHNANMCQGAASGHNQEPFAAGGVALLLDVAGDDSYRSGCWSQGVGYFLGIGALLDLAGDDSYESWVYIMGSGAHGGFGLQLDARGDDAYNVGGWNSLAMSVDYGIGFFLDGAGHDRYQGGASGHGISIGLGISLFQDSAGDDTYLPKDATPGTGRFYEQEDYNADGKVSDSEKRHFGFFLDLGGSDRYPAGAMGNGQRWDGSPFAGGIDVASPKPPFAPGKARGWDGAPVEVTDANWENLEPADLLKLHKGDVSAKAEFALAHGLRHEGSELLSQAGGDPQPLLRKLGGPGDYAYFPKLRLWLTKEEATWAPKLEGLKWASPAEAAAWKPDAAWPKWVQREARIIAVRSLEARKAELEAKVQAWQERKDVKALLDRKQNIEALRTAALDAVNQKDEKAADAAIRKLAAAWNARKANPVASDLPAVAKELDALDPAWGKRFPAAAANARLDSLTLESVASTPEERAARAAAPDLSKLNSGSKTLFTAVNDYRAMFGRAPLAPDEALQKYAAASAKAGKPADAGGTPGIVITLNEKARGAGEVLEKWRNDLNAHVGLLLADITVAGAAVSGNGEWFLVLGRQ